ILDKYKLGAINGTSIATSSPSSFVSHEFAYVIERDNSEATWEEILMTINSDSNTSINTLIMMFMSGSLAIIGLYTNSLHIVVAGMLIAPGFMPISRIALGIVTKVVTWKYGLYDFFKGYLLLLSGAAFTSIVFLISGYDIIYDSDTYYVINNTMFKYWTTFSYPSIFASIAASIAGAIILATRKSVFASGVMIGLALVPSASIIASALLSAEFQTAGLAFLRFITDSMIVFVFSLTIFYWKKYIFIKEECKYSFC
ncbi:MAG: DUF389 domain-containing protein, partial [Bacteroidales bacterium]|nr:DUF389 domain-containing protein [Bacteroidales bacterium]